MCRKESWGAIAVPKEAHSTQRKSVRRKTAENGRAWLVEVRTKGTKSNLCSIERSELRPLVPGWGSKDPPKGLADSVTIHLERPRELLDWCGSFLYSLTMR